MSEDLERSIKAIAELRALYLSRETGHPVSEDKAGWILGQYKSCLSCLFVRNRAPKAGWILARMGHLGKWAKAISYGRGGAVEKENRDLLFCMCERKGKVAWTLDCISPLEHDCIYKHPVEYTGSECCMKHNWGLWWMVVSQLYLCQYLLPYSLCEI